jgi:acyl carrier protein
LVHGAGGLFDNLLRSQNASHCRNSFAPKVGGIERFSSFHLQPLQSIVSFSSIAAMIPTAGQANYSAANSFVDYYSDKVCMFGLPSLSIQWGGWKEVGMAARNAQVLQRLNRQGLGTVSTIEGLRIFSTMLSVKSLSRGSEWQILASPLDLHKVNAMLQSSVETEIQGKTMHSTDVTPKTSSLGYTAMLDSVRDKVSNIVSIILDDEVQEDKSLIEMGIDSLGGMELQNRLTSDFGLQMPNTLIFDYPSIDDISAFICKGVDVQVEMPQNISVSMNTDLKKSERDASYSHLLQNVLEHTQWPLTEEQTVFWTHFLLKPQSTCYNMNCVVNLGSGIDYEVLSSVYECILSKHPILRVTFSKDGAYFRVTKLNERYQIYDEREGFLQAMSYPFDLVNGPVTRMHVYESNVLFVTHHIVADWRSIGDIASDIKSEYGKLLQLKQESSSLEFELNKNEDLLFIESTLQRTNKCGGGEAKSGSLV